jgi:hypothetical protein
MRFEDLAHLKAPDSHGKNGCLDQDADGYWWIRIEHANTKMGRDHRIPTRVSDGVIDAIHRQHERSKDLPNHFGGYYLFRREQGLLPYATFSMALRKLAPYLQYEGHSYVIAPHQFRHSIATDMIEQGVDIYTVKEFLGHKSLAMTEKYVKIYLSTLKAKYDAYRVKKQQTYATEMMTTQIQVAQPGSDVDGGWLENKVGKLYVSPLPDGIGNCVHLPMHDGCPDSPHCPTCPKLRANKRHLPVWENKATNLLITVEALRANPAYARARQKHEQELAHAEKVIKTINEGASGMDASTTVKRTRTEQCQFNAQAKSEQKRRVAFEALTLLQQEHKLVTKAAVAKRAGVSVVFLRSHPDLVQAIEEAERRRLHTPTSPSPDRTKDQVIAALRRRLDEMKHALGKKDAELRQKQREIDQLYGKLAAGSQLADSELRHLLTTTLERLTMLEDQVVQQEV